MKNLLKSEELAVFAAAIGLLYRLPLHLAWWQYGILFFAPDIGMLGYLAGTKTGAWTYNLLHHKAVALALVAAGYLLAQDWLRLGGWIMLAHSAFDRTLGYGLKYPDNFKHTSLGYL